MPRELEITARKINNGATTRYSESGEEEAKYKPGDQEEIIELEKEVSLEEDPGKIKRVPLALMGRIKRWWKKDCQMVWWQFDIHQILQCWHKEDAEKRSCIKEIRKKRSDDKRRRSHTQKHAASNKIISF